MPIKWKSQSAIERLIGSLLAAHPNISLNYAEMAVYFGQNATYDAIQSRFRGYHKMANDMRAENQRPQQSTPTRRRSDSATTTPSRVSRSGGVTKPRSSQKSTTSRQVPTTPTKGSKLQKGSLTATAELVVIKDENEHQDHPVKQERTPINLDYFDIKPERRDQENIFATPRDRSVLAAAEIPRTTSTQITRSF